MWCMKQDSIFNTEIKERIISETGQMGHFSKSSIINTVFFKYNLEGFLYDKLIY